MGVGALNVAVVRFSSGSVIYDTNSLSRIYCCCSKCRKLWSVVKFSDFLRPLVGISESYLPDGLLGSSTFMR